MMADFCEACCREMGFDGGDLAERTKPEDWAEGKACSVICEGCGFIQVDPKGNCVSKDCIRKGAPGHGLPWLK